MTNTTKYTFNRILKMGKVLRQLRILDKQKFEPSKIEKKH